MIYQNENFGKEYDLRCRSHRDYKVCEHLHDYSEILFCKRGQGEIVVRGKRMTLCENSIVFVPPNCPHEYMCQGSDVICAVFSNDYIPLFFRELESKTLVIAPVDAGGLE